MKKMYGRFIAIFMTIFVLSACTQQNTVTKNDANPQENASNGGNQETNIPTTDQLFLYGDVVAGGACVLQNRFTFGDQIVFRMNVEDAGTGEQPEDAKVIVHLSTGEELEMHLGSHPPDMEEAPKFWTVSYTVPEDAQTGTLEYFVTAETTDKSGEYRPFQVKPSLLTIVPKEEAVSVQQQDEGTAE